MANSSSFEKFQNWAESKLANNLQAITDNPWIGGLTQAMMKLVPLVMVSSLVTIYDIVRGYIPTLPDMGAVSTYTFGISGLAMAYLIAYHVAEKLGNRKKTYVGLTSLSMYLMAMMPVSTDAGTAFNFGYFGSNGMFVAMVLGFVSALLFYICNKINFFGEDSGMPDFCIDWFDTLIPMSLCIVGCWALTVGIAQVDLYGLLGRIFAPLVTVINSQVGCALVQVLKTLLYCMGISTWVFTALSPATRAALQANIDAFAGGVVSRALPYVTPGINTITTKGGVGNTMALNIMFLFSKSKRLRMLGKVYVVPTILNINEPIVFGSMLWNPILMIPSALTAISNAIIWGVACFIGIVQPQHVVFSMWYCPGPIWNWILNGFGGVLVYFLSLAVDYIIYLPFFKIYEKTIMKEDGELAVEIA